MHELESKAGELRLHVDAPNLPELFAEAARALAELQLEAVEDVPAEEIPVEEIHLEAPDVETLLVDWLNELLLRAEGRNKVYTDVFIEGASQRHIDAIVRGVPGELRTEIRGATLHNADVHEADGGICAKVALAT